MNNIVAKANRTLGLLKRNINIGNRKIKRKQAYQALVRPVRDYCSTVWKPYTATLENKLEMAQRRAARFVLNSYRRTSSVGSMLEDLKWTTLAERRRTASLVMFYKIHNGLVAVDMPPSLTPKYVSTTLVENSKAYHIAGSTKEYHQYRVLPEDNQRLESPKRGQFHRHHSCIFQRSHGSGHLGYLTGTQLMYKCWGLRP